MSLLKREKRLMELFAQLSDERREIDSARESLLCPLCWKNVNDRRENESILHEGMPKHQNTSCFVLGVL